MPVAGQFWSVKCQTNLMLPEKLLTTKFVACSHDSTWFVKQILHRASNRLRRKDK